MSRSVADFPAVRILVVGDSGVGKTCGVNFLCTGKPVARAPEWTVGSAPEVMLHQFHRDGVDKQFFIEFMDVGGHKKHELSRSVFYNSINGIILMYDMANLKSFKNLRKWIKELVRADSDKPDGVAEKVFIGSSGGSSSSWGVRALHGSAGAGGALHAPGSAAVTPDLSGTRPGDTTDSAASGSGDIGGTAARVGTVGFAMPSLSSSTGYSNSRASSLRTLPVLVIANKTDLSTGKTRERLSRMVGLDLPSVEMSATKGYVSDQEILRAFFDDVVTQRHNPVASSSQRPQESHHRATAALFDGRIR